MENQIASPRREILFMMTMFLDGGTETVLLSYLRLLSERCDVEVAFCPLYDMGSLEVFSERIPSKVHFEHIVPSFLVSKRLVRKAQGLAKPNRFICLADEVFINPVRRLLIRHRLSSLAKRYDLLVDFRGAECHSFVKNLPIKKTTVFHWSLSTLLGMTEKQRQGFRADLADYDHLVVIAKAMVDEARQIIPELCHKVELVYNPQDTGRMLSLAAAEPQEELPSGPFVLAVQRLVEEQKDTATLLKAYALMVGADAGTPPLYVLGKGCDEQKLRDLAGQLGLADRVFFHGFTPNPYIWIKKCRLLVLSTKYEALPTVLIEGLLLRKVMVATNVPTGPDEILAGGRAGLLVPPGNPEALKQAMQRALQDNALRQELLANGERQAQIFTSDAAIEKFLSVTQ